MYWAISLTYFYLDKYPYCDAVQSGRDRLIAGARTLVNPTGTPHFPLCSDQLSHFQQDTEFLLGGIIKASLHPRRAATTFTWCEVISKWSVIKNQQGTEKQESGWFGLPTCSTCCPWGGWVKAFRCSGSDCHLQLISHYDLLHTPAGLMTERTSVQSLAAPQRLQSEAGWRSEPINVIDYGKK